MSAQKNRLGRGLDKLISTDGLDKLLPASNTTSVQIPDGRPLMIKIELVDSNPDQPRKEFNEKELQSLAQSIKSKGIIEPLVVTKKDDGRFEIIAGERRLKAAKSVNLVEVPVIIREISEDPADRLILALLENLCREDLNPVEEAESFSRLEKEFGKTHQEIAVMSGRERPTITNAVRLLKLPDFIQDDIRFSRISPGHGRAILALTDQNMLQSLRTEIITKKLSVRQTEALVKKMNRKPSVKPMDNLSDEAYFEALAKSFTSKLGGLKVKINHSGKSKKLEIFYANNEELEYLMKKVGVDPV